MLKAIMNIKTLMPGCRMLVATVTILLSFSVMSEVSAKSKIDGALDSVSTFDTGKLAKSLDLGLDANLSKSVNIEKFKEFKIAGKHKDKKKKKAKKKNNKKKKNKRKKNKNPIKSSKKAGKKAGKVAGVAAGAVASAAVATAVLGKDAAAYTANTIKSQGCKGMLGFLKDPRKARGMIKKIEPGLKKAYKNAKGRYTSIELNTGAQFSLAGNRSIMNDGYEFSNFHRAAFKPGKIYKKGSAEMQRIGNSAIKEIQQQLNIVANKMTKQSAKVVKLFTNDKFVCGKDVKYKLAQLEKLGLKADLNKMRVGSFGDTESLSDRLAGLIIPKAHAARNDAGWQYFFVSVGGDAVQGYGLGFTLATDWKTTAQSFFTLERYLTMDSDGPGASFGPSVGTGWAQGPKPSTFSGMGFGIGAAVGFEASLAGTAGLDASCGPTVGFDSKFHFSDVSVGCGLNVTAAEPPANISLSGTISQSFSWRMY